MAHTHPLSRREKEVAQLLLQGKSNKQIALALGITEHTVEFHLKNIYSKLEVASRVEAVVELGKSVGGEVTGNPREPVVDSSSVHADNDSGSHFTQGSPVMEPAPRPPSSNLSLIILSFLAVFIIGLLLFQTFGSKPWEYQREYEHSDEYTVGQRILRSNAFGSSVHGQFGTTGDSPWPAKPGYLIYRNIKTPDINRLYLKIRYSKHSSSSTPILIYVDDESHPRTSFYPMDTGDWNTFIWTEPLSLGSVHRGLHSLLFYTDGQQNGVADLDIFMLTASPP